MDLQQQKPFKLSMRWLRYRCTFRCYWFHCRQPKGCAFDVSLPPLLSCGVVSFLMEESLIWLCCCCWLSDTLWGAFKTFPCLTFSRSCLSFSLCLSFLPLCHFPLGFSSLAFTPNSTPVLLLQSIFRPSVVPFSMKSLQFVGWARFDVFHEPFSLFFILFYDLLVQIICTFSFFAEEPSDCFRIQYIGYTFTYR